VTAASERSGRPEGPAERVLILGAAGRDFHDFLMAFRDDPRIEVIAFTAAQIPGISDRRFPPELAGPGYPAGIPIVPEDQLETLCREKRIDRVVLAYSDLAHEQVMHLASRALAAGADFALLGPRRTMLESRRPVIAVSAVRTGCGKSPTARWIARRLRRQGVAVAVIRHPMPYGDLARQVVQRFASRADLDAAGCTIEEREEYEPHIEQGGVVFAGVDYRRILAAAESEAGMILWDGGNNDFPFVRPDLHVVLVDPLRPGHELRYHPGETVLRMADVVVIAKSDAAGPDAVAQVIANCRSVNPHASIVRGGSPVRLDDEDAVRGRRVLVIEDGPTITHGGMAWGAGHVAALGAGAGTIVDPRLYATPVLRRVYQAFPHIGPVLPATGYSAEQLQGLVDTVARSPAEVVVSATPIDLTALAAFGKPVVRARYEFADLDSPGLGARIDTFTASNRGPDRRA